MPHQFSVEGNGIVFTSPDFNGGTTKVYAVTGLKPGTYQIVRTISGHQEVGMVSNLVVK